MPGRYTETRFAVDDSECDPFGLINFNRYVEWVNITKHKFFDHNGVSIGEMESAGVNLVTVNFTLRCLSPCRRGDAVVVRATAERLTPGSIYLAYTGRNSGSNETIFRADTIMYPLDTRGAAITFSPVLLQKLQPLVSP
ncbi:MAG TPA: acyl-CoA thioesterase [Candidatus Aminicenantes bacterium]|nr:acyl-CoA thioesterase [Candidatus Aminicenantes bacterium]